MRHNSTFFLKTVSNCVNDPLYDIIGYTFSYLHSSKYNGLPKGVYMEEDFEVFNRYRSRSVKTPLVTIQRGGTISLNWAAFQALGKPKSIELSYSPSKRIIRLRKADSSDLRGIPVYQQGRSDCYTIAGLTFTKDYDIDISIARRYTGAVQGDFLLIDLNAPSIDATGPRARNYKHGKTRGRRNRSALCAVARHQRCPTGSRAKRVPKNYPFGGRDKNSEVCAES